MNWLATTLRELTSSWYRRWLAPLVQSQIEHHARMGNTVFGGDTSRLKIAPTAKVYGVFCNVSSGNITVGDYASVTHGAMLITGTHDPGERNYERQEAYPKSGRDIVVGNGAWICAGAIVLGPCVIGDHAVVGAGAVVNRDVPPSTVVAGVPARVIRKLS